MLCIQGNRKLGKLPHFSLPPVTTCPGKTELCEKICYGLHGQFTLPNVIEALARRYELSQADSFVGDMIGEVYKLHLPLIKGLYPYRLHEVGDFYSLDYILKWDKIISACPGVTFYGYTRAWRDPELLPALEELRLYPNLILHASIDWSHEDRPPPDWRIVSIGLQGNLCSYERHKVKTCMECGRCFLSVKVDTCWNVKHAAAIPFKCLPMFGEQKGEQSEPGRLILWRSLGLAWN